MLFESREQRFLKSGRVGVDVMTDIPVRVAVRVRPTSVRERSESAQPCVVCFEQHNQVSVNGKMFAFDNVFDTTASQENVYDACAAPMLEYLFKGYNCTLLAYGQTGSGKTYTMGTEETADSINSERRGIITRMVDAIFEQIGLSPLYSVSVSMLEIYEERVIDLLTPSRDNLQIREMKGAVFVQGLSSERVSSLATTMQQLEKGSLLRSKGETAMNDKSSRSHAIFTVTIEKLPDKNGEGGCFRSKLHLVDLAGSEKLKKTQAEGERMREGIKINEGLLALGNVIAALAEAGGSTRHIPYRDSKITRLLQDSLGGNSYTVMIACVSPADTNAEETLSTLRYADRTKKIKNKPIVNVDPSVAMVESLRAELATVRHELAMIKTDKQPLLDSSILARAERLEKELAEANSTIRSLNLRLAEEVAGRSIFVEQLFAATQAYETLKERMRAAIEEKTEESELLRLLEVSFSKHSAIQDDEQQAEEIDKEKESQFEEDESDEATSDPAYVTEFAEKQSALSHKFASLLDEIRNKEKAFEATEQSKAQLEKMRETHEAELEELQAKLAAIERERDDLQAQLRGTSIHHKLSEDRRRRLHELEKEIDANRKRIKELKRIEKENAKLQEHAKKLTQEIEELKKLRVKMARQMKSEEAKFRKWKLNADRELMQMKNRERKREAEVAREKQMTAQQLAVYRRKYEEASACNRRLQQMLVKGSLRPHNQKGGQQLITFLENELDIAFSTAEARDYCEVLIEQRKALSQQLSKIQERRNRLAKEPPRKKRTSDDRSSFDNESEKQKLDKELTYLQQEIELRATEISDLQSKCVNSDEREEQRWSMVNSLADAKIALKQLFEAVVSDRRTAFEKEKVIEEQRRKYEEERRLVEKEIRNLKEALKQEQRASETMRSQLAHKELDLDEMTMDIINSWNPVVEPNGDAVNVHLLKRFGSFASCAKRVTELERLVEEQSRTIETLEEATKRFSGNPAGHGNVEAKNQKTNRERRSVVYSEDDSTEESTSFDEDDPDDVTYTPRRFMRQSKEIRSKRSKAVRRGTFVIEKAPMMSGTSTADDGSREGEQKENTKEDKFDTAADLTYVLSEANDSRPLPKTMLTTDPVELMKMKKRKGKVVTRKLSQILHVRVFFPRS
uniref:Kinesin motor domain-containing protein n=1 Tax=Parascaris univalens TaxID=6257 RepID=A0A915C6H6_PARUN